MKLRTFVAVLLFSFFCVSSAAADDTYNSAPTFSPYYAGSVKAEVLNNALQELNYIRWLIGVPNNVTLNSDYTKKAQHGAVLLDAIDTLTHTPAKPSDMSQSFYELGYDATTHGNLAVGKIITGGQTYGNMTISKSLKSYMDDSDNSNISRIGHRRWLMNPRLKQTGFGISTRRGYSATYVIEENNNRSWPISDEFITWPTNKREHPLTYFYTDTAWCVVLNSDIFDKSTKSSVKVTLTRLSDGKSWNFSSSNSDGDFYDNQESYAYDECIIFRPNNISGYNSGEEWRVNVSGLTRKDGGAGTFYYTVKFTNASTGYDSDIPESSSGSVTYYTKKNNSGGCNAGLEVFSLLIILGIPRVKKISFERVGK